MDWRAWQRAWDKQQERYRPHREDSFDAMLAVVGKTTGLPRGRILDLACGCGSITARLLRRFPGVRVVGLDLDPTLLEIARGAFAGSTRVTLIEADLREPDWTRSLPRGKFDAVVTATALHWLSERDLRRLYRDLAGVVRRNGLFANSDHMPVEEGPRLAARVQKAAGAERERLLSDSPGPTWEGWWRSLASEPVFRESMAERRRRFPTPHQTEFAPPSGWHVRELLRAGFSEASVVWRSLDEAVVAAVR